MDTKEHFYTDDPAVGPADVRTALEGVDYFFLGNGHIQAAVQLCAAPEATPLGLLVMDPDRLGAKRAALSFDPERGLAPTRVEIEEGESIHRPRRGEVEAVWTTVDGAPAELARWRAGEVQVEERFYCPDRETPRLVRELRLQQEGGGERGLRLQTGAPASSLERRLILSGPEPAVQSLAYTLQLGGESAALTVEWLEEAAGAGPAGDYWKALTHCRFGDPLLTHLFDSAKHQLGAAVSAKGTMDASIWQYGREWLRDQATVITARLMLGEFAAARTSLRRLLTEFVSEGGDTMDAGTLRPTEETELDQNGELLLLLEAYVAWTGDTSLIERHWPRIRAVAAFPLSSAFRHEPSGLLRNRREYWERHVVHGVEEGFELAHQLYVALGLGAAARLTRLLGNEEEALRWEEEGGRLGIALLSNPRFSLVDDDCFIKRRGLDGEVQREITPEANTDLPRGIPLFQEGPHRLDPDSATTLPISTGLIDPRSALAANTLAAVEELWNQAWDSGGYSRYDVTSEAGSPSPWPVASLRIAQAWWEAGDDEKVWRVLHWLGEAPGARAGSWLEFFGPDFAPPYPQVGILPWTWAELVILVVHHVLGVRPGLDGLRLRPRLPAGLNLLGATLRIGEHSLSLELRRAKEGEAPGFLVNGSRRPFSEQGLELPAPREDLQVVAILGGERQIEAP